MTFINYLYRIVLLHCFFTLLTYVQSKNGIVVETVNIFTETLIGEISCGMNFVWFENSSLPLYDAVRLFRYRFPHADQQAVQEILVNKISYSAIQGFNNTVDDVTYNRVHNKLNVTLIKSCLYRDDGKTSIPFTVEYANDAKNLYKKFLTYSTEDSLKNIVTSYNKSFSLTILDSAINIVFPMYYYPSLELSTTDEEMLLSRTYILAYIATTNKSYQKYLEIGCRTDDNFKLMKTEIFPHYAVGVDPNEGGTHRMTSDAYFEMNAHNESFDVIFIDGLHEAHQVYRDVLNAIRILRPNGAILLHDCNPTSERAASTYFPGPWAVWNGDTWKAIVALRLLRKDLDIVTIDTDHGVGVIRKRHPTTQLHDHWKEVLSDHPIHHLNYTLHLEPHRVELLNLITIREFKKWFHQENNFLVGIENMFY